MDTAAEKLTVEYLWKIGNHLSSVCPPASRHCLFSLKRLLLNDKTFGPKREKTFCNHCGNIWLPNNHRVRVRPCPVLNKSLKKLLKAQQEEPWTLTRVQKKKIRTFKKSYNKIVYTCFACKKTITFPGPRKVKIMEYMRNSTVFSFNSTFIKTTKSKKKEVNAGLFIPSVSEKTVELQRSESMIENSFDKRNTSSVTRRIPLRGGFKTPQCTSLSNTKSSSSKKRKQSLLHHVLNHKKESKSYNLASFLISLQ